LRFNGVYVGEVGLNAALCGHYGVPCILVTGDEATCRESRGLLGDGLTTVAVKKGLTRYSARQIPPVRAREMIEAGAFEALQNLNRVKPYEPGKPCEITIEIGTVDHAQQFMGKAGVEIVEPLTVVSRGADWMTAWNQIWGWTA
jgi:D-amino peptidase